MADIMGQIGDALALVDDSTISSAAEATWAAPSLPSPPAHSAAGDAAQWTPSSEPQVPIGEQLLSPAAQHRSELARQYAQAAAVAFATPAAAASYVPPPLPAHKYPHIKRSSFAGHVTRLRQARAAAGLPPVPTRDTAEPGGIETPTSVASGTATSAHPTAPTPASLVPAMFFSREYRLSAPGTFACVLGGSFGGNLGEDQSALQDTAASQELATAALRAAQAAAPELSSLRVSPALQHTLSNFLDFVEGDLAARITGRKEQLFSALRTLHTLWDSVVVANNAVAATKERVSRSRGVLSAQALQVLALRRRQARAAALKRHLLQLKELAMQKKSIQRMLSRGSHASALAACRALRAKLRGAAGGLKCSGSLLDAISDLEAATADAVSKQFNSDAMSVVSGALDASSALHMLSRGSLSPAAAAAIRAYVQGWQASHAGSSAPSKKASDAEASSLLQVLAWSGAAGCEAAVLQFLLRRQLGTLGSLGPSTMHACLETLSGKVAREVKALITTEVCEGVRVLQLREAVSGGGQGDGAAPGAAGDSAAGSNPFEYDWESVGGDTVSISTVQRLAFSDFCDMLVALLVALHRCLRRVARLHGAVQQVMLSLAQSGAEGDAAAAMTLDDAASLGVLSRDIVVAAASTAQKQVSKLLRARRKVHSNLKVPQMGALMTVCDAFAASCGSLTEEAAAAGAASPRAAGGAAPAPALGGSELMLEATTQVRAAMKTLHTRNMTSLPALLDSEVWKAVSVQPTFHALVLELCAPGLLGSAAVATALPALRRTLAAQPSTIADELAAGTLARVGDTVQRDAAVPDGAVLLSALGAALPLRCVADWPQLRSSPEATALKLDVYLSASDSPAPASNAATPPSLVVQDPPPPPTKRLHVPAEAVAGVTVVQSRATHAQLQVSVAPFTVVGSALMLVKMMGEYVAAARLMPHAVSGDAAVKLAELIRKFNTHTTQLVLNGGAVTNGTLKTIYAKHLAATATSLRAVSCLLPAVRSSFSCVLPASQHGLLKDLWRVGQDLDKHVERIFDKFSSILQDTFAQSLENIGSVDWNKHVGDFDEVYPLLVRDAVGAGAVFVTSAPTEAVLQSVRDGSGPTWGGGRQKQAPPTTHMQAVIKNTETLHRIISASLSSADLCRVFSSVAVMLSAQLPVLVVSASFSALSAARPEDGSPTDEGLSDYGNKRLAWDVVSLLAMLRRVPGLGLSRQQPPAGAADQHDDLTAGQVALSSIESWVKRQFGVVLTQQLYAAFDVDTAEGAMPQPAATGSATPEVAVAEQGEQPAADTPAHADPGVVNKDHAPADAAATANGDATNGVTVVANGDAERAALAESEPGDTGN